MLGESGSSRVGHAGSRPSRKRVSPEKLSRDGGGEFDKTEQHYTEDEGQRAKRRQCLSACSGVRTQTEAPEPGRKRECGNGSEDEEAEAERIEPPRDHLRWDRHRDTDRDRGRQGDAKPAGIHG